LDILKRAVLRAIIDSARSYEAALGLSDGADTTSSQA
jgi:hypothetical protein